jgi:hypothetical protein
MRPHHHNHRRTEARGKNTQGSTQPPHAFFHFPFTSGRTPAIAFDFIFASSPRCLCNKRTCSSSSSCLTTLIFSADISFSLCWSIPHSLSMPVSRARWGYSSSTRTSYILPLPLRSASRASSALSGVRVELPVSGRVACTASAINAPVAQGQRRVQA